ncbi:MAG: ATP-binding protein, partial [Anaerolineae bacterium]|nr:ATP-binding protein [Anaerolineae bacterium]
MCSQRLGRPPCGRGAEELPTARSEADLLALTQRLAAREVEPTDLAELCGQATRSVHRRSPRHEICLDFDPPEIIVNADAQRIGEVVNNLLENAIRYSPGGGNVLIRGRIRKENSLITITDEGIGITEEDLRHIFE